MRLIVFDCDGTLVDSQAFIVGCMQDAFRAGGLPPPDPAAVRRIVGLSLAHAIDSILGGGQLAVAERLAGHYRDVFNLRRERGDFDEPLFPGTLDLLDELRRREILLGVATGKTMRGLRYVLGHHGLEDRFVTLQTADLHPSKPHPAMLEAAMRETGVGPEATMLVGDTTFDIAMAVAAGALPVGVSWGNHPAEELRAAGAPHVLNRFDQLLELLPV